MPHKLGPGRFKLARDNQLEVVLIYGLYPFNAVTCLWGVLYYFHRFGTT